MGNKRKRHRKSEDNVDERFRSKRRRSSNVHHEFNASSQQPQNAESQTNHATVTSIHRAVERAVRILAPPEGLNLDQRKLWRELTRTAAAGVAAYDVQSHITTHSQGHLEMHTPNRTKKTQPADDDSTRKDWSTTKLAPTPQRKWHFEERNKFSLLSQVSPQSNLKVRSVERETSVDVSESESSSDSEQRSGMHGSQALEAPETHDMKVRQVDDVFKRNPPPFVLQGGDEGLNPPPPQIKPMSHNLRRSSYGPKVPSIPSYSGSMDTASAFERFTAFLRRGDEDSSEDESEEGENGSVREKSEPYERRQLAEQPPLKTDDLHSPSQTSNSVPSLDVPVNELDESAMNSLMFNIDNSKSPSLWQTASKSTPPIKANVGIKRHGSLLEPGRVEIVTAQSGTTDQLSPHSPVPKLSNYPDERWHDSDDESADILQTIDEISRNVFASTRPLPASKLPLSPDPKSVDLENGMLTLASSNRRVTRSMSTPKNTPKHDRFAEIPIPEPAVIVCNSVRVPDIQHDLPPRPECTQQSPEDLPARHNSGEGDVENQTLTRQSSSSSLSELSRSPSPPKTFENFVATRDAQSPSNQAGAEVVNLVEKAQEEGPALKTKRKMTGMTSKHFTPDKRTLRRRQSTEPNRDSNGQADALENPTADSDNVTDGEAIEPSPDAVPVSASTRASTARKRKGTGRKSSYFTPSKPPLDPSIIDRVDFYNSTGKKKRVPAGVSAAPVPPISSARFGIIQEKLWQEPFWLLIAVTFLNKTAGRAAAPVFWELKKRYPTAEELADANLEDLHTLIWHLGLQRQRSKRLIAIATAWVESPPRKEMRWRTLHYPVAGDGKAYKQTECIEEDSEECTGALEIGHIPGCGPYAWDSWRMFCRDVLRGVAEDYNGKGADNTFVPEWRKVLPLDKELRACLRWMWLRDGWIWNHETGEKRKATAEETKMAEEGEMEVADDQERKFAVQAAGAENVEEELPANGDGFKPSAPLESQPMMAEDARFRTPEPENNDNSSDKIILSTPARAVRRSARLTA